MFDRDGGGNYSTKGTLKTLEVLEEKLKDGDTLLDCWSECHWVPYSGQMGGRVRNLLESQPRRLNHLEPCKVLQAVLMFHVLIWNMILSPPCLRGCFFDVFFCCSSSTSVVVLCCKPLLRSFKPLYAPQVSSVHHQGRRSRSRWNGFHVCFLLRLPGMCPFGLIRQSSLWLSLSMWLVIFLWSVVGWVGLNDLSAY